MVSSPTLCSTAFFNSVKIRVFVQIYSSFYFRFIVRKNDKICYLASYFLSFLCSLALGLYNDCWYGFWVRSWWLRVLWQAVTLWLVNREIAMRQGRPVEQVCDRKETTWYENHAVRFRQSPVRIESRARDTQPIRGVSVVSDDTACKGVQALPPGSRKKIWSKKKSPLWVYVSPFLKLTTNCMPLSIIKWEKYIFYKEVCFVTFIEVRSLSLIMFLVGSVRGIKH